MECNTEQADCGATKSQWQLFILACKTFFRGNQAAAEGVVLSAAGQSKAWYSEVTEESDRWDWWNAKSLIRQHTENQDSIWQVKTQAWIESK